MKRKTDEHTERRPGPRREARASLVHVLARLDREARVRLTRPRVRLVRPREER